MIRALLGGLLVLLAHAVAAQVQEVVALAPAAQAGVVQAACYQKIELAISVQAALQAEITHGTLNPYDPREVDLTAEVLDAATGQPVQSPALGFYTERFRIDADGQAIGEPLPSAHPWRLRLALARPGHYRLRLHCRVRGAEVAPADTASAPAAGPELVAVPAVAGQHGPLHFPQGQPFLEFADGKSFFAIGENLTAYSGTSQFVPPGTKATGRNTYPPYAVKAYRQVFKALHASGGNFARVMLLPSTFEFEWEQAGNYRTGQNRAQDLDALLALAEQQGIYLQLSAFSYEGFHRTTAVGSTKEPLYDWRRSPYRTLPGVSLPIDVFRDPADGCSLNQEAKQLFANKLRYLVARWGYSPHLVTVEIFNEFDNLDHDAELAPSGFYWAKLATCTRSNGSYVDQMQVELARQVRVWCPRLLVTTSPAAYLAGGEALADSAFSYYSYHYYNDLRNYSQLGSYVAAYGKAHYRQPVQWGEYGFGGAWYHAVNLADFRNPLWSSAFSGSFGAGVYFWSWGVLHHNWPGSEQGVVHFRPVARFFAPENLNSRPYQPLRTPFVPEAAAPRPCLADSTKTIGPPECLDPALANRNRPDEVVDSALAVPATLLPSDLRLEAYALHHPTRVLGWVHHRDEYWYNLPHNCQTGREANYMHPSPSGKLPAGYQLRRYVSNLSGATLRVPGLLPHATYRLEWWQTLGAGGPRPGCDQTVDTDADGTAVLPVPDLVAPDAVGNAPDYAFKLWLPTP